ncbi:hypothetical protein Gotur_020468 [Gossypium turneri]
MDIGGCLILLQSWVLYQMPFLASINYIVLTIYFCRWSTNSGIGRSYMVLIYRLMIENHAEEGFIWMSYSVLEIMAVIPSSAYVHSNLWGSIKMIREKCMKNILRCGTTGWGGYLRWIVLWIAALVRVHTVVL